MRYSNFLCGFIICTHYKLFSTSPPSDERKYNYLFIFVSATFLCENIIKCAAHSGLRLRVKFGIFKAANFTIVVSNKFTDGTWLLLVELLLNVDKCMVYIFCWSPFFNYFFEICHSYCRTILRTSTQYFFLLYSTTEFLQRIQINL